MLSCGQRNGYDHQIESEERTEHRERIVVMEIDLATSERLIHASEDQTK
jgi:hypothetical protein